MYATFALSARRLAAVLCLALVASLLVAGVASADTFTVTGTGDDPSASCTAGQCTSLRAAVIAADNENGTPVNNYSATITVPAGTYTLTIPSAGANDPASGDLDVTPPGGFTGLALTINGAGAGNTIIKVNDGDRAFAVDSQASLNLSGVTIQGGSPATQSSGYPDGGAIYSAGALTLSNDVLTSDQAPSGSGGAVRQTGSGALSVDTSAFTGDSAANFGGAIADDGTGTLNLTNDSFGAESQVGGNVYVTNQAGHNGGAVYDAASTSATISNSGFYGNRETGGGPNVGGGALELGGQAYTLSQDEFDSNQAVQGGAIRLDAGSLTGTADAFVGNAATVGGGGAIVSRSGQPLSLTNTTLANNAAADGGALALSNAEPVSLLNDTLWENSGSPADNAIAGAANFETPGSSVQNTVIGAPASSGISGATCDATLPSHGHNVGTDSSCVSTTTGDTVNASLALSPPALNGGRVATDAEPSGASTIDAGAASVCPSTDARGVSRPQGSGCDIGAFELVAPPPTTTTTTTTVTTPGPATTATTTTTVTAPAATPPPGTPPAATTRGAMGVTSNGAFLGGSVDPHGINTSYSFQVGTTKAYGLNTVSGHTDSGPLTLETRISGLRPSTTYHYRLVATSAAGTTRGADRTFRTASAYDGAVRLTETKLTVHRGRVSFTLRCTSRSTCRSRVGLTVPITLPRTHTAGTLVVTRGSAPVVTVRAHRTATVSVPVSSAALTLLSRAARHRLAGTALIRPVTAQPPGSARVTLVLR